MKAWRAVARTRFGHIVTVGRPTSKPKPLASIGGKPGQDRLLTRERSGPRVAPGANLLYLARSRP